MTPLPSNPKVLVLVDEDGMMKEFATNVSQNLEVTITDRKEFFDHQKLGLTFINPMPFYDFTT